jgi:hypothetical protein
MNAAKRGKHPPFRIEAGLAERLFQLQLVTQRYPEFADQRDLRLKLARTNHGARAKF